MSATVKFFVTSYLEGIYSLSTFQLTPQFLSKLYAISMEQKRRRKANDGYKKARWCSGLIFSRTTSEDQHLYSVTRSYSRLVGRQTNKIQVRWIKKEGLTLVLYYL